MDKKTRKSYTFAEKVAIIEYAKINGNRPAARIYGIGESCIRRWRSKECTIKLSNPGKRANRVGKVCYKDLEAELKKWVIEKRTETDKEITFLELKSHAKSIAESMGLTDFMCSNNWLLAFLRRNKLSLKDGDLGEKSTEQSLLPNDWMAKAEEFTKLLEEFIREEIRKQLNAAKIIINSPDKDSH